MLCVSVSVCATGCRLQRGERATGEEGGREGGREGERDSTAPAFTERERGETREEGEGGDIEG